MALVHDLIVAPQARPLVGSVPVPPDEAIGRLVMLVAALSVGTSELRNLGRTGKTATMTRALARLGVGVGVETDDGGRVTLRGVGLAGLTAAGSPIDCAQS